MKPLYAEKAVSQKEHDDAVSAEQIGAADVAAAKARLTEARLNLEYTKVEAPVSGISTRAVPSEGTLVSGPSVLLTRSEEHTSELQSRLHLVCRLLLEKKN